MSRAVQLRPRADLDIDEALRYLAEDSLPVATRVWRVPGFDQYLVFYRDSADAIDVIRVLHGARDIDGLSDWSAEG